MFHELYDEERKEIIAKIKATGHCYIIWHDNLIRIRRRQAVQMLRTSKYVWYGFNKDDEYVFHAITNENLEGV